MKPFGMALARELSDEEVNQVAGGPIRPEDTYFGTENEWGPDIWWD